MYNLFLDDVRDPKDVYWVKLPLVEWKIVRNYNEFCAWIEKNGLPKFISYDHDLAFEHYPFNEFNPHPEKIPYNSYKEKTGYHCAKWLIDYCIEFSLSLPDYIVHSQNPVGGENIRSILENYKRVYERKR